VVGEPHQDSGDASAQQAEVPETRTERRRRRTHQALLGAGVDVIARVGVSGLTIASITEAADVALGSFYNHFEDREHYLRVLFLEQTMDWLEDIRSTRHSEFETEADRVAAATIMLVRRTRERPAWGVFIAEAIASAGLTQSDLIADLLQPSIERGAEQGCFTIPSAELAARLTLGLIRQSLIHLTSRDVPDDIEEHMATIVLRMLGTPDNTLQLAVYRALANLRSD